MKTAVGIHGFILPERRNRRMRERRRKGPERKSECLKNRIQHIGSNGVLNAVLEKASPDLGVYSSEVIIYIPP